MFQRKDGRWVARVSLGNGKRHEISGDTCEEVLEKKARVTTDAMDGLPLADPKQSTRQYLAAWLEDAKSSLRPSTVESYDGVLRLHLFPVIGDVPLGKLGTEHVRLVIRTCGKKVSPRTTGYVLSVLRRALNVAVRQEILRRNVASLVDAPKHERTEVQPFDEKEFNLFREEIRGDRFEAMYLLSALLGFRKGEVTGLSWSAIDFAAGTVAIVRQLQRIDGAFMLEPLKTKKSRRLLKIPKVIMAALQARRKTQLEEKLKAGPTWSNAFDLVFTTRAGTPLDERNVLRMFGDLLEKAKLRHVSFHSLRHHTATLLFREKKQAKVVSGVLGHSSTRITLDIYTHLMPEALEDVATTIDEAVSS